MAVRPGQYVSGEGRVYHPYLAGWREDVSEFQPFLKKTSLHIFAYNLEALLNLEMAVEEA